MADVNSMYQLMLYIINKNQTGYFSPDQFNLVINQAQQSYTSYLIGEFQSYQYGRPIARVEFGQNTIIRERLTPFISAPVALTLNAGVAPYPSDYIAFDAMFWGQKRVRMVQQDHLYSYLESTIDPVATNPIALYIDNGFEVYPTTATGLTLSYVKKPRTIVYGFTLNDEGRQVYSAGASVQPLWKDLDILQIIVRALAEVGINLQAQQVVAYSQNIKDRGQ